jgi:hypothetical protein
MTLWNSYGAPPSVQHPIAHGQLSQQMLPFIRYLSSGDRNRGDLSQRANLGFVKGITARGRLRMDNRKIRTDGSPRKRVLPKSDQLWMVTVASCLPSEYRPCQQRFAPQCHQALRIEVLWMDCPETHIGGQRLTKSLNGAVPR